MAKLGRGEGWGQENEEQKIRREFSEGQQMFWQNNGGKMIDGKRV
jgi:hypothetical protein